jgi:thioredoxin-like negative regulator of GroEL
VNEDSITSRAGEVASLIQDLVPIYQDNVPFLSVKADQTGMSAIAKTYNVSAFPTVILFRGGVEVDRTLAFEVVPI